MRRRDLQDKYIEKMTDDIFGSRNMKKYVSRVHLNESDDVMRLKMYNNTVVNIHFNHMLEDVDYLELEPHNGLMKQGNLQLHKHDDSYITLAVCYNLLKTPLTKKLASLFKEYASAVDASK